MATYSVADAKNGLPKLIDRALNGEEVIITRHGKPVVELRPTAQPPVRPTPGSYGSYEWLRARREARPGIDLTSVELLDQMYDEPGD